MCTYDRKHIRGEKRQMQDQDYEAYVRGVYGRDLVTEEEEDGGSTGCLNCEHFTLGEKIPGECTKCKHNYPKGSKGYESCVSLYKRKEAKMCVTDWGDYYEGLEEGNTKEVETIDVDTSVMSEEQRAKRDAGKLKLSLVPTKIIKAIAEIREYGCKKYVDPENWRRVSKERYRDAAYRHFLAYIENPAGLDKESGLPTLWHLACNICFLCELEQYDKERDWER